ncbi:MAG: hypothetical protein U5L09_13845 [Bacteroidales bacterium]|nr:hypothetical protein [Bacteroidales bacterium]
MVKGRASKSGCRITGRESTGKNRPQEKKITGNGKGLAFQKTSLTDTAMKAPKKQRRWLSLPQPG